MDHIYHLDCFNGMDEYVDKDAQLDTNEVRSEYGNITFRKPDGTKQRSFHLRDIVDISFPFELDVGDNNIVLTLKNGRTVKHEFTSRLARDYFIKFLHRWGHPLPEDLSKKPLTAKSNETWIRMETFSFKSQVATSENDATNETA
ncbi:hypothetical protein RDWZM_006364 [Blomia tropicalis]|uniref:Uncharacterized protein n=1 Tax=Blomia tropicalis TaxID=40697 RepID=A0A9Q0M7S6_BLOTA|nr:hypothetical protein BLOT_008746 [Blomia tropicalis]KAJ6220552.1 hypothetical protein RDWZM_006364 [Blomia tropicalis]